MLWPYVQYGQTMATISIAVDAHVFLLSASSWICTAHPMGANGILLKSKVPNKWAWAETVGTVLDWRNRLMVNLAWGRCLSHSVTGKAGSVPQRIATEWFLELLMATSAMLRPCHPGGTKSSLHSIQIISLFFESTHCPGRVWAHVRLHSWHASAVPSKLALVIYSCGSSWVCDTDGMWNNFNQHHRINWK